MVAAAFVPGGGPQEADLPHGGGAGGCCAEDDGGGGAAADRDLAPSGWVVDQDAAAEPGRTGLEAQYAEAARA